MSATIQMPEMVVPSKMGMMLTELADTADLEAALRQVITDYLHLKLSILREQVHGFQKKWGMTFAQFADACEHNGLSVDAYAYSVESDFWEWEEAQTLLAHYEALYQRWL
ncbi:MAG: hypothetical protein U0350_25380 [Caldilineaceae bacterium]